LSRHWPFGGWWWPVPILWVGDVHHARTSQSRWGLWLAPELHGRANAGPYHTGSAHPKVCMRPHHYLMRFPSSDVRFSSSPTRERLLRLRFRLSKWVSDRLLTLGAAGDQRHRASAVSPMTMCDQCQQAISWWPPPPPPGAGRSCVDFWRPNTVGRLPVSVWGVILTIRLPRQLPALQFPQ